MSLTISARNAEGTFDQIGSVDEKTIDLTENAEEGSVAISMITFDDPDLLFETVGHRAIAITDSEIVSGENVIYHGYTADRTFKRGRFPLGRQVDLNVADLNSVWGRRVMVGADCKRPAETDVHRMRWLITTAEAGLITDDTYLSSSSPVNMDKVDYRGQMMDQVANDCAQASGKNWGLTYNFDTGDGYQVWYGHDELATYDSGVLITNILGDVDDETSFYMAEDTTLTLDPARVFSGVMVDWEKGKVYRQNSTTAHAFARRDTIMSGKLVKTKARAIARANRYLGTLNEEDVRIETSILVPRALGNVVRPFHRVQFQSTHLPGTESPIYCRVVKRRLSYWTPEFWRLGLTLVGGAGVPEAASCTTALAGYLAATVSNQPYDAGTIHVSITPTASSVVIGGLLASNDNIPTDHDLAGGSGWTTEYSHSASGTLRPTMAAIYKAGVTGSISVNGSYTRGCCNDYDSRWTAAAVAIETTATAPVQSVSDTGTAGVEVTFGSPLTPGNLLVLVFAVRDEDPTDLMNDAVHVGTGWTTMARGTVPNGGGTAGDTVYILSRCIDGSTPQGPYCEFGTSKQIIMCAMEWGIS